MKYAKHKSVIEQLHRAIEKKDRVQVLRASDKAQHLNWEAAPNEIFNEYDKLIDKANDLILQ